LADCSLFSFSALYFAGAFEPTLSFSFASTGFFATTGSTFVVAYLAGYSLCTVVVTLVEVAGYFYCLTCSVFGWAAGLGSSCLAWLVAELLLE